jgi:hypothetical protein
VQGVLTYSGGGLALRERFVENLPSTFSELRNRADINVLLLEDTENMFWEELTVPVLEGTAHTEGHICWRHLQGKHPDVAARAVAFHAAHQDLKTQAEGARLEYRYACNVVFRPQFEETLIRTLVSLFDVSDYQYSAEATSPYMDLFRGHGEDELDTRRMSVLESIPLEHLDDLDDRIDELCKEIDFSTVMGKRSVLSRTGRRRIGPCGALYQRHHQGTPRRFLISTRRLSWTHRIILVFQNCSWMRGWREFHS